MKLFFIIISLLPFFISKVVFAQEEKEEFSILFYNVENLFDIKNDSLKADEEFTPGGDRHWTFERMQKKILNISKAIISTGKWMLPDLIGLCEVENRFVLQKLIDETPLKDIPYRIIHKESPDFRGIDVALVYNSETFYPLEYDYYPLLKKNGTISSTREILYVSGILGGEDTLHVFVNHWPSRYSGILETREKRNNAAILLRQKYDELVKRIPNTKVVIIGDFNDQPTDESLNQYLKAKAPGSENTDLVNLSYNWLDEGKRTLKYQSQWYVFDQVIVSTDLLGAKSGLYTKPEWCFVGDSKFLFEEDKTYSGKKLFRTYNGYKYNGGFSDHLPVLLKLKHH